jgi:hypothetical protein
VVGHDHPIDWFAASLLGGRRKSKFADADFLAKPRAMILFAFLVVLIQKWFFAVQGVG